MASTVRYLQLDVFAAHPGGGNPLGVVIGADGWSGADMQAFAAWTNLVETTYLLPPRQAAASYRLRIFTPTREIPFAGHPTIGSAHAALDSGYASPRDGRLIQDCEAGQLPILLTGKGGGTIRPGRVLDYLGKDDEERKACSLHLSLMDRMGVTLDRFGDAEKRIEDL